MRQRIIYIDQLKGFAILLVVVGHVLEYCFTSADSGYESIWHKLIYTFHMPLFAFLSGLFMKGISSWGNLRLKTERLLIPFLSLGSLYVLWRGFSLQSFFMLPFKYGYWYLWVMYLAIFPITIFEVLAKKLKIKKWIGVDILLFVGGFLLFTQTATCLGGGNFLSISSMNYLLPYIVMGYFVKQYRFTDYLINKTIVFELSVVFLCIGLITHFYYNIPLSVHIIRITAISVLMHIFYVNQRCLPRWFEKLGIASLELYVTHFFFIHMIKMPTINNFLRLNDTPLLELFIALIISAIICALCVVVSKLLKQSRLLAYLCFGELTKSIKNENRNNNILG